MLRATLLATVLAAATAHGQESLFRTQGREAPGDRLALFVGIDKYPKMKGKDLDGCVRDIRALEQIFRTRFGFRRSAMLLDGDATRDHIRRGFSELYQEAQSARKKLPKDKVLHVIVCYAGHGSWVQDKDGDEKPKDFVDETWVAHDSTIEKGERDILDDDIDALTCALTDLGNTHVALFFDSCHSGSAHRSAGFAKARNLGLSEKQARSRKGPAEPLIEGFARKKNPENAVFFAACKKSQLAYECVRHDQKHGRFTYALVQVLRSRGNAKTTYGELYEKISARFAREFGSVRQRPVFDCKPPEMANRQFLDGAHVPDHARETLRKDRKITLDWGSLNGVTEGAVFRIYRDVPHLLKGGAPLARATVKSVAGPDRSVAVLDRSLPDAGGERAPLKALLDRERFPDFAVRIHEPLPAPVQKDLEEMAAAGEIRLVRDEREPYALALRHDDSGKILFYDASAQSQPGAADDPIVRAVAASELPAGLRYVARMKSLLNTELNPGKVRVSIEEVRSDKDPTKGKRLDRPPVDGVPRLHKGDHFKLVVENKSNQVVFFAILIFQEKATGVGLMKQIYPATDAGNWTRDDSVRLDRGGKYVLTNADGSWPAAPAGRWWVKVFATERFYDFAPLLKEPRKTRGRSEGAMAQLEKMHEHKTRAGGTSFWATADLLFDVVEKK